MSTRTCISSIICRIVMNSLRSKIGCFGRSSAIILRYHEQRIQYLSELVLSRDPSTQMASVLQQRTLLRCKEPDLTETRAYHGADIIWYTRNLRSLPLRRQQDRANDKAWLIAQRAVEGSRGNFSCVAVFPAVAYRSPERRDVWDCRSSPPSAGSLPARHRRGPGRRHRRQQGRAVPLGYGLDRDWKRKGRPHSLCPRAASIECFPGVPCHSHTAGPPSLAMPFSLRRPHPRGCVGAELWRSAMVAVTSGACSALVRPASSG